MTQWSRESHALAHGLPAVTLQLSLVYCEGEHDEQHGMHVFDEANTLL